MSEISFQYKIKTKPSYQVGFSYWPSDSIEYGLVYQRYIALSDASTFNSPVAITKVATGFYQLYDLFVHAKPYDVQYQDTTAFLECERDKIKESDTQASLARKKNSFIIRTELFQMLLPQPKVNIYSNHYLSRHDTILNRYYNLFLGGYDENLYVNIPEKWLRHDYTLRKYQNFSLQKQNGSHLGRYQSLYNFDFINHLSIMKTPGMGTPFDNELSIYDTVLTQSPRIGLNMLDITLGTPFDNKMNILDDILTERPDRISLNVLPIYMGQKSKFGINIIPQILMKSPYIYRINVIQQLYGKRSQFIVNTNAILSGEPGEKHANIQTMLFGKPKNRYTDVNQILSGTAILKQANVYQVTSGTVSLKYTNAYQHICEGYRDSKILDKLDNWFASKDVNRTNIQQNVHMAFKDMSLTSCFLYDMTIADAKKSSYLDTVFGSLNQKQSDLFTGIQTTMGLTNVEFFKNYTTYKHNSDFDAYSGSFVKNDTQSVMTTEMIYSTKEQLSLTADALQMYVHKDAPVIYAPENFFGAYLSSKHTNINDVIYALYKDSQSIRIWQNHFAYKDRYSLPDIQKLDFASKDRHSIPEVQKMPALKKIVKTIFVQDIGVLGNKDAASTNIHIDALAFKNKLDSDVNNQMLALFKDLHSVYVFADNWAFKDLHETSLINQYFISKDLHDTSLLYAGYASFKEAAHVHIPDMDYVFKNELPAHYITVLAHESFTNAIIPISKVKHQAYIDSVNLMVEKISQDGYLNQNISASVIAHNTYMPDLDLFCDKQSFNTYIDYKNNQVTKNKIRLAVFKDEFIHRKHYLAHLEASFLTDKKMNESWLGNSITVHKKSNKGRIEDGLSIIVGTREIYCHNSIFVDKINQMCYYDYNMVWSDKKLTGQMLDSVTSAERKQREVYMLDCISPAIKKHVDTFYDYGVFTNRTIYESALFKQLCEVHTTAYDTGIRPDDFGNWVWVYETPDPFPGDYFGIDELLLPENDSRYDDFTEIIFNKQTMMPRNPVKVIDDHTFIAKYPNQHPLTSKYADVAVNYEDSAIKVEQFYGIESSVMHTVFLKFYRVWQKKVFEFGTMTMVQAVKWMLEYLYSWIMEYFPLEQIEQALRVFKLIRWYGETSIIQNSQYVVTYEYDTLESKLTSGTCLIPNNLNDSDATMYVDSKFGVIRNKPEYIGQREASVTFTIDNKKNSTFTFSLSNTVGSVNIYINDELVDTLSRSVMNRTYELPYTGETNIVKIEKPAAHNLNDLFFIGNIKIPNCTFKNLSIEFDPVLKAGNKPLNDIAKKMVAYANLYEDREEIYTILREGNLGVSEIYKRLLEYWEIHHQDKCKGKRLTIKEV